MLEEFEENLGLAVHLLPTAKQRLVMQAAVGEPDRWPGYPLQADPEVLAGELHRGYFRRQIGGKTHEPAGGKRDHKTLKTIFHLCHQISNTTEIPSTMLDKKVMAAVLRMRCESLGKRLHVMFQNNCARNIDDGTFVIKNLNSYEIVVQNKRAQAVAHISGLRADIPTGVTITSDFEIYETNSSAAGYTQ